MGKKRSDLEILAEILKIAKHGARKSHIVYKANLNFKVLDLYLERLQDSGLIAFPPNGDHLYTTTEKGVEYLHQFGDLIETFNLA